MSENKERPLWYAVIVRPRHEKAVARDLHRRGIEQYLPLYRVRHQWSDRVKSVELPLFPGYVFCRFSPRDRFLAITTPGVLSVLGFAGRDVPVDETEIEAVRTIVSSGLPIQPWLYLNTGDAVRIEGGALMGVQGTVVREKNCWRVVVKVELLQRAVAVEVDREFLSLVSKPTFHSAA